MTRLQTSSPCFIARTESGATLAHRLAKALGGEVFLQASLLEGAKGAQRATSFEQVRECLRANFVAGHPIVAILASGIIIRTLADLLDDKHKEPPVVAVDETGAFAIPLLGGHRGANALAQKIAETLGGTAVITTASEAHFNLNQKTRFALDSPPFGWSLLTPPAETRATLSALIAGASANLEGLASEAAWLAPFNKEQNSANAVLISAHPWNKIPTAQKSHLSYGVGQLALGVGTSKNAAPASLISLVEETLAAHKIPPSAIAFLATWEGKRAEPAVVALAERLGVGIYGLSAPRLGAEAPWLSQPSAEVQRALGIPGVAEAAALTALGGGKRADILISKRKNADATCAVAYAPLPLLPKGVSLPALPTAQAQKASLSVVGLGAGDPAWLTSEALQHLANSDSWVGYTGYLERLVELFPEAAQARALYGSSLGEEQERAELSLALASTGKQVSLISSGDPGIYAMASPLFEALEAQTNKVSVAVVPGISAIQATAARVGAPIGHDFCCISLSDLLTPREEILNRVEAAAGADFVIAFYNPASETRRDLLDKALTIIEQARGGATEVILAHAVGHKDEKILHTTLNDLRPESINMRTLILIGSRTSRRIKGAETQHLYTPRGYKNARVKERA